MTPVKSQTSNMLPSSSKIMLENSAVCKCLQGRSCSICSAAGSESRANSDLANVLLEAVSKMDILTKKVSSLQQCFHVQSVRLQKLEVSNNEGSECEGRNSASSRSNRVKQCKSRPNKGKSKKARAANMNSNPPCEEVSSSEDELGLRALERRCEIKQKVLAILKDIQGPNKIKVFQVWKKVVLVKAQKFQDVIAEQRRGIGEEEK